MLQPQHQCIELTDVQLVGDLLLPPGAKDLVVFVHGSGSSRLSPRNQHVARYLSDRGLATLLFDLLTEREQRIDQVTCELRFDIPMLTRRLVGVLDWIAAKPELRHLPVGLFGASTGAAAAILAAVERPRSVHAIVSRGGRTDLAGEALEKVQAPTLQIVGARDLPVLGLNRKVSRALGCEQRLEVIPGATHLFEEPGTLQEAARLAGDWFESHLREPIQLGA
ncbi:dienelactone hydrolase family protein [Pseudomonas boanensis]|uniref:Dienelactone hydrolase family protein n=1 Tax=Metapseudomonas boanensis TaxID=2822138 RepID=A0ABS5XL85_9GAMM|nr:dienelactone hydrolase family protein [Pseudomonas boanensis]MBT8768461.1 dienelactone hydrolase family protein [Pseudomonas boanensis]